MLASSIPCPKVPRFPSLEQLVEQLPTLPKEKVEFEDADTHLSSTPTKPKTNKGSLQMFNLDTSHKYNSDLSTLQELQEKTDKQISELQNLIKKQQNIQKSLQESIMHLQRKVRSSRPIEQKMHLSSRQSGEYTARSSRPTGQNDSMDESAMALGIKPSVQQPSKMSMDGLQSSRLDAHQDHREGLQSFRLDSHQTGVDGIQSSRLNAIQSRSDFRSSRLETQPSIKKDSQLFTKGQSFRLDDDYGVADDLSSYRQDTGTHIQVSNTRPKVIQNNSNDSMKRK